MPAPDFREIRLKHPLKTHGSVKSGVFQALPYFDGNDGLACAKSHSIPTCPWFGQQVSTIKVQQLVQT